MKSEEIIQKLKDHTSFGHTNSPRVEYFTPVVIEKSKHTGRFVVGCYRRITEHVFYEEYDLEAIVSCFINAKLEFLK